MDVASARDSERKSDVQMRRLRGPVESVSVYEIHGAQTWEQTGPMAQHGTHAERFDQAGNIVEEVVFGTGGTREKRTVHERGSIDPQGNWREETYVRESVDERGAPELPRVAGRVRREISCYPG